jgi:fructose-1,6-bisphosphatase/inositol monophosphatase family enzyme
LYWAQKGKGAFKNGEKIQVSEIDFGDMRCGGNFDYWQACKYNMAKVIEDLHNKTYWVSLGSTVRAAMCVAEGFYAFDLFPGSGRHDIAAAKIIVEEAGGIVRNFFGEDARLDEEQRGAIFANKATYKKVAAVVLDAVSE